MSSPGGAPASRTTTTDGGVARSRFRPELQGLRALAVVLVVVYHVWVGRVSGGVDVFFLITGFLITGGLHRAAARGGVDVLATWRRQFSRLLPAVTVVLVAGVVAGFWLLPENRWMPTVRETVASLLFLQNWELAHNSVDYAARDNAASIVQHFWSLSIQGQFYLLAPLVVAGVAIATRRDGADLHRRLTGTLLAVGGASFAYSVYLTLVNQPLAYFHSATRIWEFALGGLLALWISRIEDRPELTPATRAVLGWGGVAALVSCGILLQVDRAFPGWAALWPTLAAAMVLVAGRSGHRFGVDRLLSGRVLRTIGDISFPLYLWHWPILTLTLVRTGQDRLDLEQGAAVIAVSFVLAWLTHRFVEQRVAALDVRHALRTGGVLALTVLVAAGSWYGLAAARASTPVLAGSPSHPGAGALSPQFDLASLDPADAELTPSLVQAPDDWSYRGTHWDCGPSEHDAELEVCTVPAPDPGTSERTVAVVGDSHAQQYAASLAVIAEQRNWSMVGMFRGACPMSVRSETVADDQGCTDWNAAVHDQLVAMHPDAVLTLASRDVRPGLHEQTPEGFVQAWQRLDAAGIPVVAVRDNPRFDFNVVDCVATQGRGAPACEIDRHTLYQPYPPWSAVPGVPPNVVFADVADGICDPAVCRSEVGNVLVYMDDNHLTATYARTLAPALATAFDHLGW